LLEPVTGGDPMSEAKYVRRSLGALSAALAALGHPASPSTVAELLRPMGYHLYVNVKRFTGPDHPDRDRQFRYLQGQVERFRERGLPIISVDTKKKELIGGFKNPGSKWGLQPEEVNCHDFRQDALYRAVPYGIYDVLANRGHVCVGLSADTPAFAVASIRTWWARLGCKRYGALTELLILADAGGSNGCRPRLWKRELQGLADYFGLVLTVGHYPTGASKWNPVEHRLFGPISINWSGEPLRSLETMTGLIRGTTTATGLVVSATVDRACYPTKVKVAEAEMAGLNLHRHEVCPQWNYTIKPRGMVALN
jgi:Rhodopirellula transposase DDE domain